RIQHQRRGRTPIQKLIENRRWCVTLEWNSPRRHLEEDDSQSEKICARIERFTERLFWRHVADGANGRADARYLSPPRHALRAPHRITFEELRHAEVEDLDSIVVGNHDVGGLQVAVEAAGSMGARTTIRDVG